LLGRAKQRENRTRIPQRQDRAESMSDAIAGSSRAKEFRRDLAAFPETHPRRMLGAFA